MKPESQQFSRKLKRKKKAKALFPMHEHRTKQIFSYHVGTEGSLKILLQAENREAEINLTVPITN